MFDIITKQDYWSWLADGVTPAASAGNTGLSRPAWQRRLLRVGKRLQLLFHTERPFELKDVQDAFVMSRLRDQKGMRILEVGGGMPRLLRLLSQHNETWLIDKYEGVGRGPRGVPSIPGITLIQGFMGEFDQALPESYFDVIFSVSVIEHVPLDLLESFFADCSRVLKPSGRMYHAIDTYLFDPDRQDLSQPFRERLRAYLRFADRPDLGIRLLERARIDEHLSFSCAYASLPDNVLHEWYLHSPQEKRLFGQVVSIKSIWEKYSPPAGAA